MSKALFTFKAAAAVLIICLIASAAAFSEEPGVREIVITSKSLITDNKNSTALFEGSVVAIADSVTIYSDSMKVSYSSAESRVVEIHASGNVRAHNNGKAIFSKEATYSANEGKITFTGSPKVVDGENIITGEKIVYFIKDDRAVVEDSRVILKNRKKEE
ncbi:MAG: lipopolysaccharide transport periplasmic protein LptA [Nitrospirae bacterium]|nr:lipopolysaccharide transport periplasmic protein LptA [Nitrospirota bacterium]